MAGKVQTITCISGVVIACSLAVALQLVIFDVPPPSSALSNGKLQEVIKLGEGFLDRPEDVAIDKSGVVYTASRDGGIKRLHGNGTWENWRQTGSAALLGLTTTAAGDVVVCDAEEGLLKVSDGEEGVKVITSHYADGTKIRFADDVIESSEGMLYFSVASTKFGLHNWVFDVIEATPHGQLLQYDPSSNSTSILLHDLAFANGVALSAQQDYLVICESWKFRCLKYWLEGDMKGQTQNFIDNLPGAPDNINLAPDGSFWIALFAPRWMRFFQKLEHFKFIVRAFRQLIAERIINGAKQRAMVVNVASSGKIIRGFDDPTGKVMAFVTSALEFEDHLYLGSLHTNFIGKLPLTP